MTTKDYAYYHRRVQFAERATRIAYGVVFPVAAIPWVWNLVDAASRGDWEWFWATFVIPPAGIFSGILLMGLP